MARNLDYEGELDICAGGYSSDKHKVAFTINFDVTPEQRQTRDDPYWPAEVSVNSVSLRCNGAAVECPQWLEQLILEAVDEEVLLDYATEGAE